MVLCSNAKAMGLIPGTHNDKKKMCVSSSHPSRQGPQVDLKLQLFGVFEYCCVKY